MSLVIEDRTCFSGFCPCLYYNAVLRHVKQDWLCQPCLACILLITFPIFLRRKFPAENGSVPNPDGVPSIPLVQESGSAQSQIFRNGFAAVSNIKRCPSFDFLKSRITLPTLFSAKTAWSNSKYQTGPKTIPYWNTTIPVKKIQGFSFSRLPKFTN